MGSPALMVCKWVAKLFDQQVQAGRVRAEQVSAVQAEVSSLMDHPYPNSNPNPNPNSNPNPNPHANPKPQRQPQPQPQP